MSKSDTLKSYLLFTFVLLWMGFVSFKYFIKHPVQFAPIKIVAMVVFFLVLVFALKVVIGLLSKIRLTLLKSAILAISGAIVIYILLYAMSSIRVGIPFTIYELSSNVFIIIQRIAALLIFLAVIYLTGSKMFRIMQLNLEGLLKKLLYSICFGCVIWITYAFILASLKLLYPLFFIIPAVVIIIVSARYIGTVLVILKRRMRFRIGYSGIVYLVLISVIVLCGLINALTPEHNYDALNYHLTLPKIYLKNHGFSFVDFSLPSNTPLNGEMMYLILMTLGDRHHVCKLLHFAMSLLVVGAIFVLIRISPGKAASRLRLFLTASAIFLANPVVFADMGTANIDLTLTFFEMMALLAMLAWTVAKDKRWLYLSAILCGVSLGTKLYGVYSLVALTAILLCHVMLERKERLRSVCKYVLQFWLIAVIACSPWLIKNYILADNPVYPLLYKYLGGRQWDRWMDAKLLATQKMSGEGYGIYHLLRLPWDVTINGSSSDFKKYMGVVTPLWIIFVPFAVILLFKKRKLCYLILYSAIFFVCWGAVAQQIRYMLPLFPVLSVIAALGMEGICGVIQKGIGRWAGDALYALTAAIMLLMTFDFIEEAAFYMPAALGAERESEFLTKNLRTYAIDEYISNNLGLDSKILFIGDARHFYCDRDIVQENHAGNRFSYIVDMIWRMGSEDKLLGELKRMGITHVAIREWPYGILEDHVLRSAIEIFEKFKDKYLVLVTEKKGIFLYEIREDL